MKTFITNNWWSFLFNGAVAIIYGLLALLIPREVLELLVKYTGILLLIAGTIALVTAITKIRNKLPYGVSLSIAVLLLASGYFITFMTSSSIQIMVSVVGIWALVTGIFQLIILLRFKAELTNKPVVITNILITIAFGLVMLFNPFEAARFFIILSGILAFGTGLLYLWFGFKVKRIKP